jgi:hypothetical protein
LGCNLAAFKTERIDQMTKAQKAGMQMAAQHLANNNHGAFDRIVSGMIRSAMTVKQAAAIEAAAQELLNTA